jgi:hypothetical protein
VPMSNPTTMGFAAASTTQIFPYLCVLQRAKKAQLQIM